MKRRAMTPVLWCFGALVLAVLAACSTTSTTMSGSIGYQLRSTSIGTGVGDSKRGQGLEWGFGPQFVIENDRGQMRLGVCGSGYLYPQPPTADGVSFSASGKTATATGHVFSGGYCFKADVDLELSAP